LRAQNNNTPHSGSYTPAPCAQATAALAAYCADAGSRGLALPMPLAATAQPQRGADSLRLLCHVLHAAQLRGQRTERRNTTSAARAHRCAARQHRRMSSLLLGTRKRPDLPARARRLSAALPASLYPSPSHQRICNGLRCRRRVSKGLCARVAVRGGHQAPQRTQHAAALARSRALDRGVAGPPQLPSHAVMTTRLLRCWSF
jgi:hypothetical protein